MVGFAAESECLEEFAREKLERKKLDMIVANNISQADAGFNVDTNRVLIMDHQSTRQLPLMSKPQVAEKIIDSIIASDKWRQIINPSTS